MSANNKEPKTYTKRYENRLYYIKTMNGVLRRYWRQFLKTKEDDIKTSVVLGDSIARTVQIMNLVLRDHENAIRKGDIPHMQDQANGEQITDTLYLDQPTTE